MSGFEGGARHATALAEGVKVGMRFHHRLCVCVCVCVYPALCRACFVEPEQFLWATFLHLDVASCRTSQGTLCSSHPSTNFPVQPVHKLLGSMEMAVKVETPGKNLKAEEIEKIAAGCKREAL